MLERLLAIQLTARNSSNIVNITNRFITTWPRQANKQLAVKTRFDNFKVANVNFNIFRQIKTHCADKNAATTTKILTTTTTTIKSEAINETNIELNDLELNLKNGLSMTFNLTWLRDSCHCNLCTHQSSRQRLFTPKDFQKHMFAIEAVNIHENCDIEKLKPSRVCWPKLVERDVNSNNNNSYLEIIWADGHESFYAIDWLTKINSLYTERNLIDLASQKSKLENYRKFKFPQDDFYLPTENKALNCKYWTVDTINNSLEPVDYHDLIDGFDFAKFNNPTFINANKISDLSARRLAAMFLLSKQLVTYGLAKIVNVPQEPGQVLNVVRSLAYERPTGYGTVFNVVVEPSEEINLAYSAQELDLHSDLNYRETSPGVQLLHCITNSSIGGMSYFSDAFNAAQQLRELDWKLFEVLVKFPLTFVVRDPYRNIKFRRQLPILSLDFQANLKEIHYGPYVLPPVGHKDDVKLFYLALDKYTQLLHSKSNKLIAKMEPGDLFIFHNRRVLHGRSAFDPTISNRFLQGCYMDWDEIECLYEKLHPSSC